MDEFVFVRIEKRLARVLTRFTAVTLWECVEDLVMQLHLYHLL